VRHPQHNYATPGGYFVTFVTAGRRKALGVIRKGKLQLSWQGGIVLETWRSLPEYFQTVILDAFAIMPDHVHCIIILVDPNTAQVDSCKAKGIPQVVQGFKGMSARRINSMQGTRGSAFWQPGYIDRVIRNEKELEKYRYYIETNSLRSGDS